jgi:hypothetical protein
VSRVEALVYVCASGVAASGHFALVNFALVNFALVNFALVICGLLSPLLSSAELPPPTMDTEVY